ncbi:hypothetical protein P152DRAFT_510633 [Eremomyces bilateralis CBS 781.70]|uniref:WD40 repeat-like protein n=1 Tax=Eremomyces bilateralis CBS 781.70 TaxID=1392243 RepID=A0A6G1GHA9_9PEZI|nr:uncharacterized protein P152DRAFT_510633 [Eremomyces bilateralis CBS 781.70]KAF1817394.1 hypothetical protein P152DRAFT_510633 [Eremomyces bilateralis CBS 781.70]
MSYPLLAVAWDVVKGRPDIANIVQEIVGQHVGDLSLLQLQANVLDHISSVTRVVSWIRILFDLQRTYPNGPGPGIDAATSPLTSTLSSENIISCMLYLIQIKSKLFPAQSTVDFETARFRYHVAFTLLAGVRILLLRNDALSPDQRGGLKRSIVAAWQHTSLPEDEKFLVLELLPAAISQIRSESHPSPPFEPHPTVAMSHALGNHYFNLHPDKFVPSALARLSKYPLANLESFWILFDSVWTGESTLIKTYLDNNQTPSSPSTEAPPDGRALQSTWAIEDRKRALIRAIMQPQEMSSNVLSVLQAIFANIIDWKDREDTKYRIPELQDYMTEMQSEFEQSVQHLIEWLKSRANQLWACNGEMETLYYDIKRSAKCWVLGAASVQERLDIDENMGPIYVLSCPALHPIPHKLLARHLRDTGSSAYEELLQISNFIILETQCPRCPGGQTAQSARLIEPIENLMSSLLGGWSVTDESSSRFSKPSNSIETSSRTGSLSYNTSHSSTRPDPVDPPATPLSSVVSPTLDTPIRDTPIRDPPIRDQKDIPSLDRLVSPLSPNPHYGLQPAFSSQSLPTSQPAPSLRKPSFASLAAEPAARPRTESLPSTAPPSISSVSRKDPKPRIMLGRRTASMKAKPTKPTKPTSGAPTSFTFSIMGDSVLVWGAPNSGIAKLDIGTSSHALKSAWYNIPNVQYAAAGNHRSAIIASDGHRRKIITVTDGSSEIESDLDIELSHRPIPEICISVSRDDNYIAMTLNDDIHIFQVQSRRVRRVILHDREQASPLHGSHHPKKNQVLSPSKKALSWREVTQETARQNAILERKLSFTKNNNMLIVATHLADHCVYLDVWEANSDGLWGVKTDYNRSFKLPPWTTNDGDLTSIFYDSLHRSAFLTAFLGKTYPLIIPIPGYDHLHPDDLSPRTLCAAQSPSCIRYAALTSLTDLHLFDYKANGTLSPRRIKKATAKIPSVALKVGHVGLAMPSDTTVQIYWTKDTKLMLRTVSLRSEQETVTDRDLRSEYDRVVAEHRDIGHEPFDLSKPSLPSIDDGAAELMGKIDEGLEFTMSGALPGSSSPGMNRRGTLGSRRVIELDSTSVQELPGDWK